jgi:hypothetical protein
MNRSAPVLIGLLVALLAVACSGQATPAARNDPNFPAPGPFVSPDVVKQELDRGTDFLIVDVRPPEDYKQSHITGAINVPFFDMEQRYTELPQDRWLVFY